MIMVDNLLERYLLLCYSFHTNWDVAKFANTSKDRVYRIIDILDRSPQTNYNPQNIVILIFLAKCYLIQTKITSIKYNLDIV